MTPGSPIVLARYFTFAGANGSSMNTEWVALPAGYQNWQLTVVVYSRISTTAASLQLVTSWDQAVVSTIGSSANLATLGNAEQDISSGMGPYVRLNFSSTADSVTVVSVYLTPKSE